jgi:pyrroline-5-carboxylate reductase
MGGAIIKGYLAANKGRGEDILVYDMDQARMDELAAGTGARAADGIGALARQADVLVLAVKPKGFDRVLAELRSLYRPEQIVVSVAAGISIAFIASYLGERAKIVRTMPNTPALTGAGMTALSRNAAVNDEEFAGILEIFRSVGKAEAVDERLMDTVVGLSGSSPAYAYMFIEALTECAVQNGMDGELAKVFAAQSLLGAAKMVLETGLDPVALRKNVCSPGGTTVEAVDVLERNGFRENIAEGMNAAVAKSARMTR